MKAWHPAPKRGRNKWPVVVFLLTRAPRTRSELARLGGCSEDTVNTTLAALEEEGLVVEAAERAGREKLWKWAA